MSLKQTSLFITASLLAAAAQAQDMQGQLSREQVRAEYQQARAQGRLPATGEVGSVHQVGQGRSVVSRAQVLQELASSGPLSTAEGSDLGESRSDISTRSRAEVHAEAVEAVQSGIRTGGKL